ncbi:MAG TPA: IPT/TIG domain-containing protein, partial [Bryobacteraceae bacterium]|nr:IPT/TIG domain-containing protein [Bryobacteraceae bacterium]
MSRSVPGQGVFPRRPGNFDSSSNTVQPGEWCSIHGTNLAAGTATWNGDFPVNLGGTTVTVRGQQAYLSYVSPTQINLQVPNVMVDGPAPVIVTTAEGTGTSNVIIAQVAPSFLLLDSSHVAAIILRTDGSGA